jgi:predicted enzyme related to lactoylglutathione lyase
MTRAACLAAVSLLATGCETAPPAAAGGFLGVGAVVYAAPAGQDAAAWYAQLFGEPPSAAMLGDAAFAVGAAQLGLDSQAQPGSMLALWEVVDIDAAFGRLIALGATPITGIQEIGNARVVIVRDPFGNRLGVVQSSPPP